MKQPIWLDERDALALHNQLLALHGGASGVRDANLLRSALARPLQHYTYGNSPSIVSLAAIYAAGILRNHPFVDGNKRTGFLLGILFLELNGYKFDAAEEEAAQAVIALASGQLDEGAYALFLEENSVREDRRK